KRASGREAYGRSLSAVHAQKGAALRISVGVVDRHGVTVRCVSSNTIELEGTRVVAHVAYLKSTGARRAALNHGASSQRVVRRLRFVRWTRTRWFGKVQVRSKTHDLINLMLSAPLRVEAAAAGRPGKLERLRGIKRNDSVIRSALSNVAVCEHGRRRVQSHRSPVPTRGHDVCR